MAKLDLWSDLHVDGSDQPPLSFTPQSDLLVIAGDISNDIFLSDDVVEKVADHYKKVIYIRGNHEHWEHKVEIDQTEFFCAMHENAQLLTYQRPFYFHDNGDGTRTQFIGMLGWYDFNYPDVGDQDQQRQVWQESYADFQYIKFKWKDEPTDPVELAEKHSSMIASMVIAANQGYDNKWDGYCDDIVIVTHTVPHVRGLVPITHPWANGNGSFYNSLLLPKVLEYDKNKLVKTWCFGHTHYPHDFMDHGIRFVCNPRGNWREQKARGKLSLPILVDSKEESEYK